MPKTARKAVVVKFGVDAWEEIKKEAADLELPISEYVRIIVASYMRDKEQRRAVLRRLKRLEDEMKLIRDDWKCRRPIGTD